jgi:hypothetical protein
LAGWRTLAAAVACGAAVAACGSGASGGTTAASILQPITFTLSVADSGNVLRLRPGDEVLPRLPLTGPRDEGWIMTVSPNPTVLAGGEGSLFFPSEPGQGGVAYHEFSFVAVAPGRTTVTLVHGFQQFTFTVQVDARD